MRIEFHPDGSGIDPVPQKLLEHLSEVLITKTDDEAIRKAQLLRETTQEIGKSQAGLQVLADRIVEQQKLLKQNSLLHQILRQIAQLEKDGMLLGETRRSIGRLLFQIQQKDGKSLESIHRKLSQLGTPELHRAVAFA